ncbi:hypothetical protein DESA109040_01265 [Deinococcus saxicola]|uniref:hypothetical protein n=1 Tax=Deinococcus saxicola TaxID=249406 RepID=UPI0039EF5221
MTQHRGAERTVNEHPLLRLMLTASESRLMANILLNHIETDSVRSEVLEALAQRLLVRAVLAEHRTPQA